MKTKNTEKSREKYKSLTSINIIVCKKTKSAVKVWKKKIKKNVEKMKQGKFLLLSQLKDNSFSDLERMLTSVIFILSHFHRSESFHASWKR